MIRVDTEKISIFKDNTTYGLEIDESGNPILLSGVSRSHYTLTIFDRSLRVINSIRFGFGQTADLLITDSGNFAVLGFKKFDEGPGVAPTYWEFTPDLQLVKQKDLGAALKSSSLASAMMELVNFENSIYAAYGWGSGGLRDNRVGAVQIKKLSGERGGWNEDKKLPYYPRMRFFVSKNGSPYVLYPKVDKLQKVSFNPVSGRSSTSLLNPPNDPVQCFPPNWKYEIIDVFPARGSQEYIVINGDPLNHPEAGCVTIGRMP